MKIRNMSERLLQPRFYILAFLGILFMSIPVVATLGKIATVSAYGPGDSTAPVTTSDAPAGWQKEDYTVALTCTDETGGSGCKETHYRVDGGSDQLGNTVAISTEGDHVITYHSIDNANNAETDKTVNARLDKTSPTITNILPVGTVTGAAQTIEADLADTGGAGIDTASATINMYGGAPLTDCITSATHISCAVTGLTAGDQNIEVAVSDSAGNNATGSGSFIVNIQSVNYFWNWYDNVSMRSWVMLANPAGSGKTLDFGINVCGVEQDLAPFAISGHTAGQVPEGETLTPIFENMMDGPVEVMSKTADNAIVSQRSLMGNSLEEVLGTEESKLSNHFWWPWYDQATPGVTDWIMVANPSATDTVRVVIRIKGNLMLNTLNPDSPDYYQYFFDIAPGANIKPSFPGIIGGPVEVEVKLNGGNVIASQRVLTGNGTAFNEVPGIPATELTNSYLWTWYDQQSPGATDWVIVANSGAIPVTYQIKIGGQVMPTSATNPGTIPAHGKVTPTFPGVMGGPVELTSLSNVIASQRVIFGPSFEEVPGYRQSALGSDYHWTWYDQKSSGSTNWVLVSNPGAAPVTYQIKIGGQVMPTSSTNPGTIPAHGKVTPTFPNIMDGPVEVISTGGNVMVSQRVLWNGYFNEVLGTVLQ